MGSGTMIFLLLGSNLGDRLLVMQNARELIAEKVGNVITESSVYETEPWGLQDQPAFLNQVINVLTTQAPEEVLRNILDIEHELARVRYVRWGARVIDIYLLFYAATVLDSARLTLPHPRIQDRRFTLVPLNEIAPDFIHPKLLKTASQLLAECTDTSEVSKIS